MSVDAKAKKRNEEKMFVEKVRQKRWGPLIGTAPLESGIGFEYNHIISKIYN